jgi:hypothetical protein
MRMFNSSSVSLRAALIVAVALSTSVGSTGAQAQQKQKSNVQRERCAQVATRAVSTPGSIYYAAPVRGHGGGGGGIAGAIIGAVVVTAIAASIAQSNRAAAENKCLVAAGLRPNSEPEPSADKPKRSVNASGSAAAARAASKSDNFRSTAGPNSGWVRQSIRSQQ